MTGSPGPQRIIVIGMSGSGKTTLAKQIEARCGIPHIELDGLFWGPEVTRSLRRTPLWNGNRESWGRSFFSRDSILFCVVRHYHDRRRSFAALQGSNAYPQLRWVELNRVEQVDEFVRSLSA
ncbi:MAG: hypothetical protein V4684_00225 [Pseudomonadota bacterium]